MTTPKYADDSGDSGRFYNSLPGFEMQQFGSVTSIINTLSKPAIAPWSAKLAAQRAVEQEEEWHAIQVEEGEEAAKKWIAAAAREYTERASNLGSAVHLACEWGGEPPLEKVLPIIRKMHGDEEKDTALVGQHLHGYMDFIEEHVEEMVERERTVFNVTDGYAGTLDMIVRLTDGRLMVGDIKTGNRIYPEVALQLAAYARAEYMVKGDASVKFPHGIDGAFVLQLRPRSWKYQEVAIDRPVYEAFLAARELWEWKQTGSKGVLL